MKIFLAGATGATGRLLADLLLNRGHEVVAVIRSADRLPESVRKHSSLKAIEASILDLPEEQFLELTMDCDAIVSCLGHNLSWKGVLGPPYRLVTKVAKGLLRASANADRKAPARFILMSSAGIRNPDQGEQISFAQHLVIQLLRLLLPPHADNEKAAAFLRNTVGPRSDTMEWVAVRPDTLIDDPEISPYSMHPSPTRSAIFNAGKTSRINVASFMADLIEQEDLWNQWQGKMPVIYNAS